MNNECGFTCLACGQFRPGPEGAHSEAECLRVQMDSLRRQLAAVTAERDRYKNAILWALGYTDFEPRKPGEPAYWWRKGLRERAALKGDADGQDD